MVPNKFKVQILKQKGYHFLWINDELWMWDIPAEVEEQKIEARKAYGRVLVVGYGLGIVQKFLKENNKVHSITTIEISKEVIEACMKSYGIIYGSYYVNDFYNTKLSYISNEPFDCIIGDSWKEIDIKYLSDYIKFKNKAKEFIKSKGILLAWGKSYFEYLLQRTDI